MTAVEVRRRRVLAAVVAVAGHSMMADAPHGVLPFHVRYFGIPECVTDTTLDVIGRDLRWLRQRGYVEGDRRRGFAAPTEYTPTEEGRKWLG